ncbi:hypothetical protein AB0873_15955 [Micromonospora sp. NPDC047707]|uniref:hypothetical protein n=1 Tax=Micromonospora sp. NPDC047707 TaxID=3154498 RepID=UPI00345123AA
MSVSTRVASAALVAGCASATATFGPAPARADTAPATCVTAPSTPTLSPTGVSVRSVATNGCTVYAIFWLMRWQSTDTGWRTVLERWMDPGTVNRLDFACRGSGTWTYRAVVWDPNMMGYLTSPDARITC